MKILIFMVSCFLAISISNAEDIKKSTGTEAAVHKSTQAVKVSVDGSAEKKKIKKAERKIEITLPPAYLPKDDLKTGATESPQAGGRVTTLRELKKIQNMEMVKLKKKQNEEIEVLKKEADLRKSSEIMRLRIRMKSAHRKVLRELKVRHKKEQMEFKKANSLKKGSKKKEVEVKKNQSKVKKGAVVK